MPRRLKITLKTLEEYGTSDGCAQCSHVRAFREAKPGLAHSEPCRRRIVEAMAGTDAGAARLSRLEERANRAIASRIEVADRKKQLEDASSSRPASGDGADDALAGSRRLYPHPGGCGVNHRKEQRSFPSNPGAQGAPADEASRAEAPSKILEKNGETTDDFMYEQAGDSEDEAMGETLTIAEIKQKMERTRNFIKQHQEDEVTMVMAVLGADPRSYRREKKQAVRRIVSELYSPPRVTQMLKNMSNHGLTPGLALDLTTVDPDDGTPWDFDVPAKREKALRLLRAQKPLFVIGSPMCTRWCTWQKLNDAKRNPEIVEAEKKLALIHLEFMAKVYQEQIDGDRFFLHEHPEAAGSWEEKCIVNLLMNGKVDRVCADQCQYSQEVQYGTYRGQPVRKATGFMSNAPKLLA